MKNWLKIYLCLVVSFLPLRLQVFIGEMQRVEEYEDKGIWLFLNLNPPIYLQTWFDVDIQFWSGAYWRIDCQINLSNDRIRNNDQLKSCNLLSLCFPLICKGENLQKKKFEELNYKYS